MNLGIMDYCGTCGTRPAFPTRQGWCGKVECLNEEEKKAFVLTEAKSGGAMNSSTFLQATNSVEKYILDNYYHVIGFETEFETPKFIFCFLEDPKDGYLIPQDQHQAIVDRIRDIFPKDILSGREEISGKIYYTFQP